MTDATFTFRLDNGLKAAFAEAAKAQDRTAAQLLRVLMRAEVSRRRDAAEHDVWFRGEVEQALREADNPNVPRVSHERVGETWRRKRADWAGRADDVSS